MSLSIGRHLVLSTAHVAAKTAELLEQWAWEEPAQRPLSVASTHYGWFVAIGAMQGKDHAQIPPELLAAMRLGGELGCEYLLFDCDALAIDELAEFAW